MSNTLIKPRKERREEARQNGVEFVPQYNGVGPIRVQHKAVLKIQINEEKYKTKKKNRKYQ